VFLGSIVVRKAIFIQHVERNKKKHTRWSWSCWVEWSFHKWWSFEKEFHLKF